VYLASVEGRQVMIRYARPGDVLGIAVLVGGPADVGVQAVEPSSRFCSGFVAGAVTLAGQSAPLACAARGG
jgi:CRP/FNR family transcriptional regulator